MKGQSCYVSGRGNYLGRALALVSAGLLKPETELNKESKHVPTDDAESQ